MSTSAQGRIRRSVRFAQLEAGTGEMPRDTSLRRERFRMTGKLEMSACRNTQDWMCTMGVSPSGRFQVVEEPRKPQPIISRKGIRQDWARMILWAAMVAMCVTLLVIFASIGSGAARIARLEARIEAAEAKHTELRAQLEASSGDISVCTRAVELNLISSNGATAIQLTAPEGARMTLVDNPEATATEEPEMRAAQGRAK